MEVLIVEICLLGVGWSVSREDKEGRQSGQIGG
jgi:hypothetical protein